MNRLSMQETQHLLVTEPAWLTALAGAVWVTRRGHLDDHVLQPGERLALSRGEQVTVSSLHDHQVALWDWSFAPTRSPQRRVRAGVALAFGFAARVFERAAEGLAALARSAAVMACRAQGCIKAGDSIASAGTVQ
jgi:uncharacterized protein (UPF0548 family)